MRSIMELLEREAALEALSRALREASSGEGRIVLVSGEAGVGKTSLVDQFVRSQTVGSAWGWCEPLAAPRPLGAIHEIARRIGGRLSTLLSEDAAVQRRLPEILQELERLSPKLLVIEDVHWADEATVDVVSFLGRRIQRLSCLLVATYRSDEVHDAHPLRRALGALATSRAVSRIELAPLSAEAVRRLVGAAPIDAALLHKQTGGNPFFISEVLSSGDAGAIPNAVRELVVERMGRLPDQARAFLQTAAVIGRADPPLLRMLHPKVEEDLEACLAVGLLRSAGEAALFRHELTREAVLATISPTRMTTLHARALNALTEVGETDSSRLAHHAYGASDAVAVQLHAVAAARRAAAVGARREAATQYSRALEYVGCDIPRERAALLAELAKVYAMLDQLDRAIACLREAHALWRSLGERRQEGSTLAALAAPLVQSGRNADADEHCRRAIAMLEPLGPGSELASAMRSYAHLRMLDRDKAQALHYERRAILMASQIADFPTLAAAHHTVGVALLVADDPSGRPYLDRSMQLARDLGLDDLLSHGYLNGGSAYAEQYRFAEAERFLAGGIDYAAARDLDGYVHYMLAWLALIRLYQGRLLEAARRSLRLLEMEGLSAISRIMALVALGRARARLGDPGADEALDQALALAAPTGTLQRLAPVRLARAEAAWLAGDPAGARAEAEAVWALATGHRHQWHAGEVAFWQSRCGEQVQTTRWIAPPFALEVQGRWREAADAWQARGCPYEQARALAGGDESAQRMALQTFDRLGARPAAAALRQQLRKAGVMHLPRGPRAVTRLNPMGLTSRQSEIATLLAEGCTNAKIARRLKISAKTVEHHVSAILVKLGAANRVEAARLIGSRQAAPADPSR